MKKRKHLFPRLFRAPGSRRDKKGSSLAFVMMVGAALVIWVMCIMPLMSTTGSAAYKTQGTQAAYLDGRSAIEFCKGELTRVVDAGEYPYTFCVLGDSVTGFTAHKKDADADVSSVYNDNITRITTEDPHDNKSTDDFPHGDAVAAICAVDMLPNGSYNIVITSWDNCEKGIEYQATFVPTGSLKIHPEAYSDGEALPLSDFVLVDGQLGANTVWNSTITMNTAESLNFYENMLSSDKAPQDGFNATIYANAGEYPAVFKTTAHTALADNSSVGEEISEGYMSSDEEWIEPHCDKDRKTEKGYVMLSGSQVWIRTADGTAGPGGANTLNITDQCTLYYNGNPGFFNGKINTYTISVSYSGTDYSGEVETGELFTKYKEGEINILPFSGFVLDSSNSTNGVTNVKSTISRTYSVQNLETNTEDKNGHTVTTYTVTLGYGKNENQEILWDNSLVYGCVKVDANGDFIGEPEWKTSNVFDGLEAPNENFSYFFYVYKPDTYDATNAKITPESDPVAAGQFYTLYPIENLTNGNYVIVGSHDGKNYSLTHDGNNLTAAEYSNQLMTDNSASANTWNVTRNSDGTWSISSGGKYLSLTHGITVSNANNYLEFSYKRTSNKGEKHGVHNHSECYKFTLNYATPKFNANIPYSFTLADSGKITVTHRGGTNFNLKGQCTYTHSYVIYSTKYNSYSPCNKAKDSQKDTYNVNLSSNLKLTNTVSASSNEANIKFYKAPSSPNSTPARPTSNAAIVESVNYKPAGFTLSDLVTNSGTVMEIYANGNAIPMIDGKYYLNAGQYTIVIRTQRDGISHWDCGMLKVNKNTSDNQASHLNVTATIDEEDKFMVHVEATGWHTDGGYHYFGFEEVGTGKIEWHSAVDVGYTFRLKFGTYNFYVKEVGSNNYGPVESGSVRQNIVMPVVSVSNMDPGMFWYILDEKGNPTWYLMPQDVYPSRILKVEYNYTWEKYLKVNYIFGSYWQKESEGSTYKNASTYEDWGTYKEVPETIFGSGYVTKYTFTNIRITIDAPGTKNNQIDNGDIVIDLRGPMGQSQVGTHVASMMKGESLYFMGNPSINTHGNKVSLTTDLLVLDSQFVTESIQGAQNFLTVQSYSGKQKILVYSGSDITNLEGHPLFSAGHFYEIPSGSNLFNLTSADVIEKGIVTHQAVKNLFRQKTYPNINMDIANASREQLSRIISSETIGWTNNGVLSGQNSESNAAYCITAYVTNVSGNVKYKANRIMMAAAKENNYSLNIPDGMDVTTRYLSIDADEVTGTSLMLYNLAQDQNFIQALSNALGITNSYSQTLQVDYERPNTRIGGINMISQICRYDHGTDLLAKAADKQTLIATYTTKMIEDLFTGGLSGLASTVKTVDRYVSIEPVGNNTTIDLSALLSVNLDIYANYVYFDPDVTQINLTSFLNSDVTISPQEDGYTTHEYLGLFQTHSADSYSGTILFFGSDLVVDFPSGSDVTIKQGFYRVESGISLSDFRNQANIGGAGSKIEAILLFEWEGEQRRAGIERLRNYSVYIDPTTGEFDDAYVDTGLDSNESGGLGGFSGGKVQ